MNKKLKKQLKQGAQLGMSHSTARGRLDKLIIFNLAGKLGLLLCYRCGKPIETPEDLTIDHKVNWFNNSFELFWDLDNIAFSHHACNAKAGVEYRDMPV